MARVRAYPRIHVALLDLGDATHRKYGGAEFTISGPYTEVEARVGARRRVLGIEGFDRRCQRDVRRALERLDEACPRPTAEVIVQTSVPQHVGLGSKTALILATLKAAASAKAIALSVESLQRLSARGGTSGVGVNAFFRGGFIVDGGHDPRSGRGFRPSSVARRFAIPPVICAARIPPNWRFHLILAAPPRYEGYREVAFFRANTPIPKREVLETMALVYHGVAAAVVAADLALLKTALREIHAVGFKKRELGAQPTLVRGILRGLDTATECAAGLSSIGPLVYAVSDARNKAAGEAIRLVCEAHGGRMLGVYRGRNRGSAVTA